jgi:hypothetical protein
MAAKEADGQAQQAVSAGNKPLLLFNKGTSSLKNGPNQGAGPFARKLTLCLDHFNLKTQYNLDSVPYP